MSDAGSEDDIFLTQNTFRCEEEEMPNFNIKNMMYSDISSDEETNTQLVQATENAEKNPSPLKKSSRFKQMTEQSIDELIKDGSSKKTNSKTAWAVRLFNTWKSERNATIDETQAKSFGGELLSLSEIELNSTLGVFISEVRNIKGEEYRGNTLYEILAAIQHFLRENGRNVNFFENDTYSWMRKVLDAKMKDLAKKGIGINKRQATVVTIQQENELWQKGILGTDTPQKLLDTLLYILGLNLALRAGSEHRNLRIGQTSQIKLCSSNGKKYLLYTEDVSKTNSGGLQHRKLQPKITRVYENTENPDRCPVKIYELYLSLRPKQGVCNALYLRPLKYKTSDVWYADSPVGIHQLTQTIARICKEAGFQGFFSNHSLRATAATRLYAAGIDEQLISEKTGHRSTAVRSYKRTSDDQLETINDVVQAKYKVQENECESKCADGSVCQQLNIQAGNVNINLRF